MNSAQILNMYNQNQISIQKVRNKKLILNLNVKIKNPEDFLEEIFKPFSQTIKRK